MKVSYIQTSPKFGDIKGNTDDAVRKIKKLSSDLVVLPELFSTGYQFTSRKEASSLSETVDGYAVTELVKVSKERGIIICAGFAEKGRGSKVYNSAVLITPQKGIVGIYRKAHLFWDEKKWFAKGDSPLKVYNVKTLKGEAFRVSMMICFDWFFPEVTRTLALKGADIICHPSNLVLPNCPDSMVTRCLENRVFAVTANRVGTEKRIKGKSLKFIGSSQITAHNGKILKRAPSAKPHSGTVKIDIKLARNKKVTPTNDLFKDRRKALYFK